MEGHAKKCLERYSELANRTTRQLYKVSTPCIDDHHLKEEELKSVRIVKSMLSAARLDSTGARDQQVEFTKSHVEMLSAISDIVLASSDFTTLLREIDKLNNQIEDFAPQSVDLSPITRAISARSRKVCQEVPTFTRKVCQEVPT